MVVPTIHFAGNCKEAINFYENAFKITEKEILYYKDAPQNSKMIITKKMLNSVMHASITICGTKFNCSDNFDNLIQGNMILFNVMMDSEEDVTHAFKQLSIDGKIVVELGPQFFSKLYGSVIDKFGVKWQIMV
jgi:PhnB protein